MLLSEQADTIIFISSVAVVLISGILLLIYLITKIEVDNIHGTNYRGFSFGGKHKSRK